MKPSDPRKLTDSGIAGHGGPFDKDAFVVETTNAVLLDSTTVVKVENASNGQALAGLLLSGRINRSEDRADVLFLMDVDGLASIVSEIAGLVQRWGSADFAADFEKLLAKRIADLPGVRGEGNG